jgi:hypothetical protein
MPWRSRAAAPSSAASRGWNGRSGRLWNPWEWSSLRFRNTYVRVLLEVGLVRVRRNGRRMLYRTNAEAIKPLHE